MRKNEFYCTGCKQPVSDVSKVCVKKTRNDRYRLRAKCDACLAKLSKFISAEVAQSGKYPMCARPRSKKSKSKKSKSKKSSAKSASRRVVA